MKEAPISNPKVRCEVHQGRGRTPRATHYIVAADGQRIAACAACWVRASDDAHRHGERLPYLLVSRA